MPVIQPSPLRKTLIGQEIDCKEIMPQISVIVPIYNTEDYLEECLNSILCQTFSDFELILVDDGSTDKSGTICDEYEKKDSRIKIIHQNNSGQSAARNNAIQLSKAEWITFVDSDDVIHPQYLEELHRSVVLGVSLCACNAAEVENIPLTETLTNTSTPKVYDVDESFLLSKLTNGPLGFITCAKIVKRNIIQEYPFTEGRVFEDNAVAKKWLYSAGKIAVIDEPLYYYRINPSGTSKGSFDAKKINDVLWSRDEIINFYKEKGLTKACLQAEQDYILFAINLYFKLRKIDKHNAAILKKKILERYKNDKDTITFSKENDRFVFELKHPKIMWLYWKIKDMM